MTDFQVCLQEIDWNSKRDRCLSDGSNQIDSLEHNFQILAHWSKSLETIYHGNDALPFLREAQVSAQDFACVYSLGLYKNSAASMRTIFESILYFSYFKDHNVELKSVTRSKFHLSRSKILQYHDDHTPNFASISVKTKLKDFLDNMYSDVSNIVHSSQPGVWHQIATLGEKEYTSSIAKEVISLFNETIRVINLLLLCTLTYDEWLTVPHKCRKFFLQGLTEHQLSLIDKQVI
ncbi:hypothetical protein [Vibrio atlanticus]|uniref:Uncharacterized protein n=1 Tax=Vibrio atlanticus TaxID=693153 RepID=A0A1C3IPR9_9VIBR|nr:hypothetical protein [Vibrio atlanticus]SBS63412.1 hypothetical protein VAT7223_01660 [Vibrio atlanticus]